VGDLELTKRKYLYLNATASSHTTTTAAIITTSALFCVCGTIYVLHISETVSFCFVYPDDTETVN
jgi:hypothetical protein